MKTIWINFDVQCRFEQQVKVSDEIYEKLMNEADGNDLTEIDYETKKMNECYAIINDLIDWHEILDAGDFVNISIQKEPQNCD